MAVGATGILRGTGGDEEGMETEEEEDTEDGSGSNEGV